MVIMKKVKKIMIGVKPFFNVFFLMFSMVGINLFRGINHVYQKMIEILLGSCRKLRKLDNTNTF